MRETSEIRKTALDYLKAELNNSYNKKYYKKYKGIVKKLSEATQNDILVLPDIKAYRASNISSIVTFFANVYAKTKYPDGSYGQDELIDKYEYTEIGISSGAISKEKMDLLSKTIIDRIFASDLVFDSFSKNDAKFLHLCDEKIAREYKIRHPEFCYFQGAQIRTSAYDCEIKSGVYFESLQIYPMAVKIKGEQGQDLYFLIGVYDGNEEELKKDINFFEFSDYKKPIIFKRMLPEGADTLPCVEFIADYNFCTWEKGFLSYKLIEPLN